MIDTIAPSLRTLVGLADTKGVGGVVADEFC